MPLLLPAGNGELVPLASLLLPVLLAWEMPRGILVPKGVSTGSMDDCTNPVVAHAGGPAIERRSLPVLLLVRLVA